MATTLRVGTEFTAVDKFTQVVSKMAAGVSSFAKGATSGIGKINGAVDGLFSKLGTVGQALLGLSVGGIVAMGIQDIKDYDAALADFRTIISDLSDKEFDKFRQGVNKVAIDTKRSTTVVAQSFEKIAGLNADLAKTSDGLSQVSKEALTLSKASGADETENLVGIMNQYSLGAKEAARVSNVLAAGQAVGASTIAQSAEAYKNFGSVAKGANVTLEQSQGLIQTLGKYSLFGAEAGTKLRGVTLQLQKAGLGYKSGQFQINDALADAQKKFNRLGSEKKKDAYLTKLFGAENITAGKILLTNIGTYQEFTKGVTGTSAAQEQAAIKGATLNNKIQELRDSFTNFLTTNDKTQSGLNITKDILGYLATNMGSVVTYAIYLAAAYALLKASMIATTIVTYAYSIALGVSNALGLTQRGILVTNTVALKAWYITSKAVEIATKLWAGAQWLLNAALAANPIILIIAAIIALIAIIAVIVSKVEGWGELWKHVWNGAKLIFQAYVASVKWYFNTLVDGILLGLDYIKKGWYEFKDAVGMGDSAENQAILRGIDAGIEARKKAIVDGAKEVAKLSAQAGNEFMAGADSLKWKSETQINAPKKLESPEEMNSKIISESRLRGNIDINVKDKGNNVQDIISGGNMGLPIKLSSTQGAF